MPLLSNKGYRSTLQGLSPVDYSVQDADDPTFYETMKASFGFVRDEERSTSYLYNRQAYADRREIVQGLKDSGMDLQKYSRADGSFDYDRLSKDTGLVRSDLDLFRERKQLLKERREQNQDVMERGNGIAQFVGMAGSYMADPINLATLPFGGVVQGTKGMSVLSKTLLSARNMAGISIATEAAIQPLVYKHKNDINSPYTVEDAMRVIGITALTAGVLGGGIGGVSGYLAKTAENTAKYLNVREGVFQKPPYASKPLLIEGKPAGIPTASNIKIVKDKLIQDEINRLTTIAATKLTPKAVRALEAEQKYLINQQKKELGKLAVKKKKTTSEQKKVAEIKGKYRKKLQAVQKKIDDAKEARAAQTKLENMKQGRVPALNVKAQKELDDWITANTKPETQSVYAIEKLAENLRLQKGFRAEEVALKAYEDLSVGTIKSVDEAREIAIQSLRSALKGLDGESAKEVESLIAKFETADDVEALFKDLFKANIDKDIRILENNEAIRNAVEKFKVSPEDYIPTPKAPAPRANKTGLQDNALEESGTSKAYDEDVAVFNTLEQRLEFDIDADGNVTFKSVDDSLKELDDDLDGLESVMRCTRG